MSRWIDADKAVRLLQGRLMETANNNCGFKCDAGSVFQDAAERIPRWIDEIPTADVRENVKGNWDKNRIAFYWKCSECGAVVFNNLGTVFYYTGNENLNYCPNCGAKMERSEE